MTKQQALTIGDVLWKVLTPLLFALCSYLANNIASTQQKILEKLDTMSMSVQTLQVEHAVLKTRVDNFHRVQ